MNRFRLGQEGDRSSLAGAEDCRIDDLLADSTDRGRQWTFWFLPSFQTVDEILNNILTRRR